MEVHYAYHPSSVNVVEREVKKASRFELYVRIGGQDAKLPDQAPRIVGKNIELFCGAGMSFHRGLLSIGISRWGTYESQYLADRNAEEELPELCKKLATWFEPSERVDLLTGKQIRSEISVEFKYHKASVKTVQEERYNERMVFFNLAFPPKGSVTVQGPAGKLIYQRGNCSWSNGTDLFIDHLGWIDIPRAVTWTAEQFEAAFRLLAKEILQLETPQVQTWRSKQSTQICLE